MVADGYEGQLNFKEDFVASDFGPRCHTDGWHTGIDMIGPGGGSFDISKL